MTHGKSRHKQTGFVLSTEAMLFAVVLVIGLIVGWVTLRDSLTAELVDTANAIEASITLYYFQDPNRGTPTTFSPVTFSHTPPQGEGDGG